MHRCSREKKKDSKHARVSVQVLALALGILCTRYCTYCTYSAHTHAAPRLAVSTAAVEAVGSWGKRHAACGSATVRHAVWAACGSSVRRRWRGGCGGNGKALYFNAAPYIYSATHSVSLTSTTRLQNRVAL